ncbi:hypothetical protein FSP39_025449 [Pinctada imbricata]|uniref:Amine oxidase n=1 Tax=Pinctada imbricata TaxID=66713 RepID=A0AA88YFF8_PINIB|nr:hypothetical protein FSP39_025449 [Pinctada imbricata]
MAKGGLKSSSLNRYLILLIVLLVIVILALITALVVVINKSEETSSQNMQSTASPQLNSQQFAREKQIFQNNEPNDPPIFFDLTKSEVKGIQKYLYEESDLRLVRPTDNKTNASYVFTMELYLPNKTDVLNFLDDNGAKPARLAKVIIFRGDVENPEINEIIVEPLPNPTSHRPVPDRPESIRYFYRPMTDQDYDLAVKYVTDEVDMKAGNFTQTAFGARLKDCGDTCLAFRYVSSFSPTSSGEEKRKIWYWLHYFVEYYLLNPVDFSLMLTNDGGKFSIDTVWFSGQKYDSLEGLMDQFNQDKLSFNSSTFPTEDSHLFSTLHRRDKAPHHSERRDPVQFYPDGQRYTVKDRHIEYMDWSLDFRLSTGHGPQIYDVKFRGNRIAYEIGLQEISVYYSGNSPQQKFSDYLDSGELIGPSAQGLIPGVDCPELATFVSAFHITESSLEPEETINAFCVFEWNTGEPLRRHYSKTTFESAFYEGMQKTVLILRTAMTIANYDYLVDFRFFPNGFMETKTIPTGFILANAFSEEERQFAFQLHDQIVGNYHLHLFHFKVDLDVGGRSNRYETLDISSYTESNPYSTENNANYTQGHWTHHLRETESEAAYHFNFDRPKYHLFYSQNKKDKYGNHKAYRLLVHGFTKQILPLGVNKEPSVSWARYQTAVTRHKETERHSSSMYAMFDTLDPIVNFTSFISDNETIVDEDLVTWISIGTHHIPHTEDLPVVTTTGMGLSFSLQPFNFFPEDPAMTSSNAVRLAPNTKNVPSSGVKVSRHGKLVNIDKCRITNNDFYEMLKNDYSIVFTE